MKKKLTRFDLQTMKDEGRRAVWMTAYDYVTAQLAEEAGMDMLLVGDSLGMAVYGYSGTVPVTMDQCIYPLRGGTPGRGQHLYHRRHAVSAPTRSAWKRRSATPVRFHKEAGVTAIKLEGGVGSPPDPGHQPTAACWSWATSA